MAVLSARDLHPLTAGLEIEALSFASFSRHVQDEVRDPARLAPLLEIVRGGGRRLAVAEARLQHRRLHGGAPAAPAREMTEAAMKLVPAGVPVLVLPMPLTGTTSPITVLGTCIIDLAELLSAVVLFQLVQPGCSLISGVGAAVADMRTGGYLCGAPEVGLINVVCIEISHFYGLPVTGTAGTGNSKASNFQAGAEAMLTGLACGLAGADSMLAFGLIDGAETVSLAKTIMDRDVVTMIERLLRDDPVDAVHALTADIREVGVGGHYLGRRSTRELLRAGEQWAPRDFSVGRSRRTAGAAWWTTPPSGAELLRTHEVPPLPDDVAAEIDSVIERYARVVGAPEQRVRWREPTPARCEAPSTGHRVAPRAAAAAGAAAQPRPPRGHPQRRLPHLDGERRVQPGDGHSGAAVRTSTATPCTCSSAASAWATPSTRLWRSRAWRGSRWPSSSPRWCAGSASTGLGARSAPPQASAPGAPASSVPTSPSCYVAERGASISCRSTPTTARPGWSETPMPDCTTKTAFVWWRPRSAPAARPCSGRRTGMRRSKRSWRASSLVSWRSRPST